MVWAIILGLFLFLALLASKKDQEALKKAVETAGEVGNKAATKGKKAAGKAAGIAAKRLDEFSKKNE